MQAVVGFVLPIIRWSIASSTFSQSVSHIQSLIVTSRMSFKFVRSSKFFSRMVEVEDMESKQNKLSFDERTNAFYSIRKETGFLCSSKINNLIG